MLGGYYLGQLYLGISGLPSAGTLSVVPSSHQLTSDNITLIQKHIIVVADAIHGLTSQNITLTQKHVLSVDNAMHTLMSENVALTSEHFLGVNDAFHGITSTEIQLTQKHTIVVDNTIHSVNSGDLDLVEHKTLVVQNTSHGHTAENTPILVHYFLVVGNALHGHTATTIGLTQKHTLVTADALHGLISDSLGGLINIQPDGFGGGWGAIESWGVKQFGVINIELPINHFIFADNATHSLWIEDLPTFIQIFDMTKTGIYIKDFSNNGEVGEQYTPDSGTVPSNNGYFGNLAPVSNPEQGFLIVKMGSNGSYEENAINDGILKSGNRGSGELVTEVIETGIYAKKDNNTGEYEEI